MATVPTYNEQKVQLNKVGDVSQTSIASEALFVGASGAEQLQDVSRGLARTGIVVQKREEELDTAIALNAEVATREAYMKFQSEARSRRGLAADGIAKDTEKWWEEQKKTATQKMTDRQRALFIQRMRGTRESTLNSMYDYQDSQVRSAKQEGAQASMASAIKLAQDDPSNADLLREALNTIQVTTSRLGAENGDAPEKVQMDMLTRTSTLHSGILGQIVDTNPQAAREYVNRFGAQMTPAARGQINKTLEVAERNQSVMLEVGNTMMKAENELQALDMVREKFSTDADAMKLAVQEVKTRFKEQEDAQTQYSKVAFDRAWQLAIDGGKGRKGVDAATWSALTPQQRDSIEDEIYQRQERVRVASDRAESKRDKANSDAQWENYYAIREQARENPQAFKERDLRMDFKNIPKDKREALIDLQGKNESELKDVTSLDKQISLTVGKLAIDKKKKFQFEDTVRDAVTQAQKAKGKPLNEVERQGIIDNMVIEGEVVRNWWPDRSVKLYEVVGTPQADKFMPSEETIKTRFQKSKGRAPTSQELEVIKENLLKGM